MAQRTLEPGIHTDLRDRMSYGGYLRLDRLLDALVERLGLGEIADRRAQPAQLFAQRAHAHDVEAVRGLVEQDRVGVVHERARDRDLHPLALRVALRAAGRTLLFSSHVMQEVAALCDRIVILGHGRVVATGTADELIAQSGATTLEDAFVALLGSGEGLAA